jgi:hypothetical protein
MAINADGSINVNTTIAATGIATEATLSTLNSKFVTGTDIGDVTVNNGVGIDAVNIQDGGNSITVDDGGGTLTIDGTVTANAGTGSFEVAQATASNLNATVVGTGTFAVQATQAGVWNVVIPEAVYGNIRNTSVTVADIDAYSNPCTLTGWNIINSNSYAVYLKFYNNTAANVTVGTTVPTKVLMLPANGSIVNDGANHVFTTGICIAATKNLADNDTTAIDVPLYAELTYKV